MTRILYTSEDIRIAIQELFAQPTRRRVAIVAYVGDGAEAYLPSRKGLHLVCSPTPGATNPDTIRTLIKTGVNVEFVDRLHMKVYWTEGKGAVVTSANLSTNALGQGDLKEAGVELGPGELDIDRLLNGLERRGVTDSEMDSLDRETAKEHAMRGRASFSRRVMTFREWYETPHRRQWKILWVSQTGELSTAGLDEIREEFLTEPSDWFWSQGDSVCLYEQVLQLATDEAEYFEPRWMNVDKIRKVPITDDDYSSDYPYEMIQVHPNKSYGPPPFQIDKTVVAAFREYAREEEVSESGEPIVPSQSLLDAIYAKVARG